MTDYPPMHPVSGYGRPPRRKSRTLPVVLIVLAVLGVLLCGGLFAACGVIANNAAPVITDAPGAEPEPQNSTPHGTAPTGKPKPKVAAYGAGTYSVPVDIKAGTYVTTVGDNDLDSCYYARLSKDGDPGSAILGGQGVLEHGAHGRMTIKASDKGVQFMGGCVWTKGR